MVSSYKVDAYLLTPYFAKQNLHRRQSFLTPYFAKQKFASAAVLSDAVLLRSIFFGGSPYSVNSCEADAYVFWKHSAITEASEWRWRDSNS